MEALTVPYNAEPQAGKLFGLITNLYTVVFGMTQRVIEPESIVSEADALSPRPLISDIPLYYRETLIKK